jgi:hypothetical protein
MQGRAVSHVSKDLILSYFNIFTIDFNSLQKVVTDFRTKFKTSKINNGLISLKSVLLRRTADRNGNGTENAVFLVDWMVRDEICGSDKAGAQLIVANIFSVYKCSIICRGGYSAHRGV